MGATMNGRSWRTGTTFPRWYAGSSFRLADGETEQNRKDYCTWPALHAYHFCAHRNASDATSLAKRLVPERAQISGGYCDPRDLALWLPLLCNFISAYTSSRIASTLVTEGQRTSYTPVEIENWSTANWNGSRTDVKRRALVVMG